MTTALATAAPIGAQIEQVLVNGNLATLTSEQRVTYYNRVCESVGLNPLTRPFEYITLNGKLVLYARRDCTDQLRKIHGVSIEVAARELVEGVYVVTARATMASGRADESIGAVPLDGLKGEARANAMMKAETKAKRRVTLSVCGLGMLDETEAESVDQRFPSVTGPAGPPVQTSGTAHLPPREVIRGGGFVADAEEEAASDTRLTAEYTEPVDEFDPKSGEAVRRNPKITSEQNKKIHAMLRDLRTKYTDADYRAHLKKAFLKSHTNELSVREASLVIEGLAKKHAKIKPEMEAQERDSAARMEEDRRNRERAAPTPEEWTREPGSDDGDAL